MKSILKGLLSEENQKMLIEETIKVLDKEPKIVIKESIFAYWKGALLENKTIFLYGVFVGYLITILLNL